MQQGKLPTTYKVAQVHRFQRHKRANAQLIKQVGNGTLGHKLSDKTTKWQLINNSAQGTLGYKIIKQIITKLTSFVNPRLSGNGHTRYYTKYQSDNIKQFSGLICRYITSSSRKIHHKKHTVLRSDMKQGGQASPLDWATDQGVTSAAMSTNRRRDAAVTNVPAGGPTFRRTTARMTRVAFSLTTPSQLTNATHGRQRRRTRYRPTDTLQLSG